MVSVLRRGNNSLNFYCTRSGRSVSHSAHLHHMLYVDDEFVLGTGTVLEQRYHTITRTRPTENNKIFSVCTHGTRYTIRLSMSINKSYLHSTPTRQTALSHTQFELIEFHQKKKRFFTRFSHRTQLYFCREFHTNSAFNSAIAQCFASFFSILFYFSGKSNLK